MVLRVSKNNIVKALKSLSILLKPKEVEEAIKFHYINGVAYFEQSHNIYYRVKLDSDITLEINESSNNIEYVYRYKDITKLIEYDTSEVITLRATPTFISFTGNEIETSLPASKAKLIEFPTIENFNNLRSIDILTWRNNAKKLLDLKVFGEFQMKKSLIFINNRYMYQYFDICCIYFKTSLDVNLALTELVVSHLINILEPDIEYKFDEETEKQVKDTTLTVFIDSYKSDMYIKKDLEEFIIPSIKEHSPSKLSIEKMTSSVELDYEDYNNIMASVKALPTEGKFDLYIEGDKASIKSFMIDLIPITINKIVKLENNYDSIFLKLNQKYFKTLDKVISKGDKVTIQKGDRIWKLKTKDMIIIQSIQR